jgi:cyanophycinase
MLQRLLFLLGGSLAYEAVADEFVAASGGRNARIAILVQNATGWEKHRAEIISPWIERGMTDYAPILPDENGILDSEAASAELRNATGIFIGGGHTPTYHRLFATEPLGSVICKRYQDGIPVAGVSAGALISVKVCQLTPDETGYDRLKIVQGLGLAQGFVIGVHFTEWNRLPEVLGVMSKTKTRIGFGIDEPACVVCEEGRFARVLGRSVFQIEMMDFEQELYQIEPITGGRPIS